MSTKIVKKKKNFSKNQKLYWRKHTDVKDVEDFLDDQRLEERIGGPLKDWKDEDLFVIDSSTNKEALSLKDSKLSKKQRALLPPKCLELLNPLTSVPDPLIKRNRVKTKEERKSSIRKAIEEKKRLCGFIPEKVLQARRSRIITQRKKSLQPKKQEFRKDLWTHQTSGDKNNFETIEWLNEETVRHNLTKLGLFEVAIPKGINKKKSVVPTVETPHPGTSYNPSLKDHQNLLNIVIEKELDKQKQEAHIKRVTSDLFRKVTPSEQTSSWVEEMSEGLPQCNTVDDIKEENYVGNEYKAINPPVNFEKKKTRKQRRKQKLEKEAALKRKEAKIEKKKVADLYKLRFINTKIKSIEKTQQKNLEKRQKLAAHNVARTKRLGGKQYEEQDMVFSRSCELKGNLRCVKSGGNMLVDRFYSLQKRNMLVPSIKRIGLKKKVKRYVKPSHKMENLENNK